MADDEVTLAAMHLFARRMGVKSSKRSVLERHWRKYHPIIHTDVRREMRRAQRALRWAAAQMKAVAKGEP